MAWHSSLSLVSYIQHWWIILKKKDTSQFPWCVQLWKNDFTQIAIWPTQIRNLFFRNIFVVVLSINKYFFLSQAELKMPKLFHISNLCSKILPHIVKNKFKIMKSMPFCNSEVNPLLYGSAVENVRMSVSIWPSSERRCHWIIISGAKFRERIYCWIVISGRSCLAERASSRLHAKINIDLMRENLLIAILIRAVHV